MVMAKVFLLLLNSQIKVCTHLFSFSLVPYLSQCYWNMHFFTQVNVLDLPPLPSPLPSPSLREGHSLHSCNLLSFLTSSLSSLPSPLGASFFICNDLLFF